MADCPEWCGPACDAGRLGGRHRGVAVKVHDGGSVVASVWLEVVGAEVRVGWAVGVSPIGSWPPAVATEFAAAVAEVAKRAARVRL